MQSCLIVLGLFVLAIALRSARKALWRKLGALVFLVASFMAFFYMTGSWWGGLIGVVMWFFLPWVELLTRIRRMRLPMENRLRSRNAPDPSFFPNAVEAAAAMEEAGFEHVDDCGWEWGGMKQHFRLFWDHLNFQWYNTVVSFDEEAQLEWLSWLGLSSLPRRELLLGRGRGGHLLSLRAKWRCVAQSATANRVTR